VYLDSNTGSMIASAVVGGAAGAAVVGRMVWSKVKSPLRRKGSMPTATEVPAPDATTEQQR
jgi:hypothetical protein